MGFQLMTNWGGRQIKAVNGAGGDSSWSQPVALENTDSVFRGGGWEESDRTGVRL